MITHVIYHIDGLKVGCTKNLEERVRSYRHKGIVDIEILEELYDKTDQEAGDIEWQWADLLGYKRERHYSGTWARFGDEIIDIGRKGGVNRAIVLSADRRSEIGRQAAMTPSVEQRSENARKAGRRAAEATSAKQRSENARLGGVKTVASRKGSQYQRGRCPNCGTETTLAVLARCHMARCTRPRLVTRIKRPRG